MTIKAKMEHRRLTLVTEVIVSFSILLSDYKFPLKTIQIKTAQKLPGRFLIYTGLGALIIYKYNSRCKSKPY